MMRCDCGAQYGTSEALHDCIRKNHGLKDIPNFHVYQPDTSQYQGDCAICGHVKDAPHHVTKLAVATVIIQKQTIDAIKQKLTTAIDRLQTVLS